MIKVKITNPDHYWKTLEKRMNKTIEEGLQDVARLTAVNLANATFPRGISSKTRESLQKAIFKDINRAYVVSETSKETDDGSYLLRNRNHKGRVPEGIKRKPLKRADYENIKKQLVKRAGLAKAGWLQCAKQLKGKTRIPAWLRSTQDLGEVHIGFNYVTITNKCSYASKLITPALIKSAMRRAMMGLYKRALRTIV